MTSSTTSTSTQQVLTSLIYNGIVFGAFIAGFILLRIKLKRIYTPKSSFQLINEEKKPEPLPSGLWQWFLPLLKKSDNFVIQQAGLDGYFFLRYLFIISAYCAVSILYVFPILLPINAANGNKQSGLNQLAYQDVKDPNRYYAHVFVGWIFFWCFLFIIYRELIYYTSMRQAVLATPRYAKKQSSRTVLFQTVPSQYLSEEEFTKLFDGVKRIWIARGAGNLGKLVDKRDKMAMKLEAAETSYLKKAVKSVKKMKKKNPSQIISNSIRDYIPDKKRPKHGLTIWARFFFGKKVDTIDYIKEELPKLNAEIKDLQDNHMDSQPFNSVFIEFESQYQAQIAAQIATHHIPLSMAPVHIGLEPDDVVWFNMRMFWWERLVREVGSLLAIVALIILWAFPVAFVGMVSNLTYLTNKLHWLNFIYNLPSVLLGLLTSLAPTIALSLLMSCLPVIIKIFARIHGNVSSQQISYFTQNAYFGFQVIQVFLVTTIASAATSAVTQIVENPSSAMTILASNLPKASNFYIAYIILKGMSGAGGALLQYVPLAKFYALGFLDSTARKKWNRFHKLSTMDYGKTFPVYSNLTVILFSYSIISPIILLFGAAGFFLLYVAHLYNLTYVYAEAPDARGIHYPRAIFQTLVGIYIGQVCLLGLFVVGKGWGPIVLQIVCIFVTIVVHLYLNRSFDNLIKIVPVDTMKPLDGKSDTPSFKNIYNNKNHKHTDDINELPQFPIRKYHPNNANSSSYTRSDLKSASLFSENTLDYHYDPRVKDSENIIASVPLLADGDTMKVPDAPWWKRFFLPHIYCSYKVVKSRLPAIYGLADPNERVDKDAIAHAYDYPAVSAKCPYLWVPHDPYGFSTEIIRDLEGIVEISDEGALINENAKIQVVGEPPAYEDIIEGSYESDKESSKTNPFTTPFDKN
ncbi:hypothetical protein KAFR_0B03710 [Kazachstania africana CBS 2517]|uniref:CSC1/OSCA1-like 7TM region domain-containing protein n=1 Tax=Kazachstania africana (strain ATCC 22294 / BCRC 22015 / CBS 2517 / CECT 1963 / NBRC 1671 / NRRL Y-8276) TaxID=1071382 RepID=H2AQL7_KAZAF|nr:hypothetical protein KAFR_0B03710 [Kazachstania africana CBS 2517]CCF56667.1 hypothetical protein KAFR_0B03710 [Kazachstania africana CBS 2517]